MNNWLMHDDVESNSLWGFDYCFCGSDCKNKNCGRNIESESYRAMMKSEPVYSASNFSSDCKSYIKPMTEEEEIAETLERR